MHTVFRRMVGHDVVTVAATERSDGDFHCHRGAAATFDRAAVATGGRRWVMADQRHGVGVLALAPSTGADRSDRARAARTPADVIVAQRPHAPVAIWAADCAPLVLLGARGTTVAAHAGWRGLAGGVIDVAVGELSRRDDIVAAAVLGPVIGPCCYSFGGADLHRVAAGVGVAPAAVSGATVEGRPALDVPAAIAAGLARHGIMLDVIGSCTACDGRWFSHRRGDVARHAVVAWSEGGVDGPR